MCIDNKFTSTLANNNTLLAGWKTKTDYYPKKKNRNKIMVGESAIATTHISGLFISVSGRSCYSDSDVRSYITMFKYNFGGMSQQCASTGLTLAKLM